ncbi:hypothetical protein [Actinokineospora sp.]|uniref:hypothetical protein n=1 Tax=Actinokineospora sp. TaxID=1872133 RepID=UPI003D6BE74D
MSDQPIADRLAAITARAAAATPGPWRSSHPTAWRDDAGHAHHFVATARPTEDGFDIVALTGRADLDPIGEHARTRLDAAFIAAAREDVPWLVERLTDTLTGYEWLRAHYAKTVAACPEPTTDDHGDPSWRIEDTNGLGLNVAIYLDHGFPVIETRDDHGETHLLNPDVLRQLARLAPGIADRAEQLAADHAAAAEAPPDTEAAG